MKVNEFPRRLGVGLSWSRRFSKEKKKLCPCRKLNDGLPNSRVTISTALALLSFYCSTHGGNRHSTKNVKVKLKQSHYRPGEALRVPGG